MYRTYFLLPSVEPEKIRNKLIKIKKEIVRIALKNKKRKGKINAMRPCVFYFVSALWCGVLFFFFLLFFSFFLQLLCGGVLFVVRCSSPLVWLPVRFVSVFLFRFLSGFGLFFVFLVDTINGGVCRGCCCWWFPFVSCCRRPCRGRGVVVLVPVCFVAWWLSVGLGLLGWCLGCWCGLACACVSGGLGFLGSCRWASPLRFHGCGGACWGCCGCVFCCWVALSWFFGFVPCRLGRRFACCGLVRCWWAPCALFPSWGCRFLAALFYAKKESLDSFLFS